MILCAEELKLIELDNGFVGVELEFSGVVGKFLLLCDGSFAVINRNNEMTIVHDADSILVYLVGLYSANSLRYLFDDEWERVIEKKPHQPSHLEVLFNWNMWESRVLAGLVRY